MNKQAIKVNNLVKKSNENETSTDINKEQLQEIIVTFSEGIVACIEKKLGRAVPTTTSRKYPFQSPFQ